jgi:hypothetical protein
MSGFALSCALSAHTQRNGSEPALWAGAVSPLTRTLPEDMPRRPGSRCLAQPLPERELPWDSANRRITNDDKLNEFVNPSYRSQYAV